MIYILKGVVRDVTMLLVDICPQLLYCMCAGGDCVSGQLFRYNPALLYDLSHLLIVPLKNRAFGFSNFIVQ